MFPSIWNTENDATRLMIASSPDGRLWNWVPGGTVLDTGEFQTFDGGCLLASPNLTETADGHFVLPYSGYRFPHKYPRGHEGFPPMVGYAVWPKGRLIALEAVQRGVFAMVAVVPPGPRLKTAGRSSATSSPRRSRGATATTWESSPARLSCCGLSSIRPRSSP
jgi:hypothetical protein